MKGKKCSNCSKFFKHDSSRSRHLKKCGLLREVNLVCNFCDKTFSTNYNLIKHKKKCQKNDSLQVKCPFSCSRKFLDTEMLIKHIKSCPKLVRSRYKTSSIKKKRFALKLYYSGKTIDFCASAVHISKRAMKRIIDNKHLYKAGKKNENTCRKYNRSAKGSGMGKSHWFASIQDDLVEEIKTLRSQGIHVDGKVAISIILKLCASKNITVPDNADLSSMLHRFVKLKKINTSKAISRKSAYSDKEIAQKCVDFINHVANTKQNLNIVADNSVWCADEVSIVEGVKDGQKSWDFIGNQDVRIRDFKNCKIRHTILLVFNAEDLLRIMVVFSNKPLPSNATKVDDVLNGEADLNWYVCEGVLICHSKTSSWLVAKQWEMIIKFIFWKHDSPQIIQFDEARAHLSTNAVRYLNAANFHPVLTPSSTTDYLQANDDLPNRCFQRYLNNERLNFIKEHVLQYPGKGISNPELNIICKMLKNAINHITPLSIKKSFKRCGLTSSNIYDYHPSLVRLITDTGVKVDKTSDIYAKSALERLNDIGPRRNSHKTIRKYMYICPLGCGKQYAYAYSPAAINHTKNCIAGKSINMKLNINEIVPQAFHFYDNDSDQLSILKKNSTFPMPVVNSPPVSSFTNNSDFSLFPLPSWGGEGASYKLVNTCPIDGPLTMIYIRSQENPHFLDYLKSLSNFTQVNALVQAISKFSKSEFAEGKYLYANALSWFDKLCSFRRNKLTIDLHGSDFELIALPLCNIWETKLLGKCCNPTCPNSIYVERTTDHITPMNPTKNLVVDLENWFSLNDPEIRPCQICKSIISYTERKFINEPAIILLNATGMRWLKNAADLPIIIKLGNYTFKIMGITYGNGAHFNCHLYSDNQWWFYDGLKKGMKVDKKANAPNAYTSSIVMYSLIDTA